MKHAKKAAAKHSEKGKKGPEAPPEKLYRPFEKLKEGKKQKAGAPKSSSSPSSSPGASKSPPSHGAPKSSSPGASKSSPSPSPGAPKSSPSPGAPKTSPSPSPDPRGNKGFQGRGGGASPSGPRDGKDPKGVVKYASAAAAAAHEKAEQAHSAADAESFAVYMSGVRALEGKGATRIPRSADRLEKAPKGTLPAVDADAPAREQFQALVVEGIRFETSDDGERIEGRRVEVEPREVRRLRRGQYTVDQQIDLHGMSAFEARKAMAGFLEKRRKEGDRVVRIIHGKGAHSPRGVSVLRGEIAAWLSQGSEKRHVAAFATAPPEDGGAGALLVLLMRPRA